MRTEDRHGLRVRHLEVSEGTVGANPDTWDAIGTAAYDAADVLVIPVAALDPAFFDLRTGVAGEVVQKATNYRLRLAVLGDVGEAAAASAAFAALVAESTRGGHLWFVADDAALGERLASSARA